MEENYQPNQPFYFSIIVELFSSVQQIAINANDFDFLGLYDLEFHQIINVHKYDDD